MQRSIPAVAAALGLSLVLAACGGNSTPENTTPEPTAAETTETTDAPAASGSITIWVDETRINDFDAVVKKFETERGVDVEVVQKASGDIRTDFIQQVPTGEGPDVIIGAHDWLGEFVTNGVVATVELGDKAAGFADAAVKAFAYEGTNYGVPYAVESIGLVRNNALATETPATFDELVELGKESGADYPVLLQQGDEGDAYHMYPLQTSFGAPVFESEADGSYTKTLGMKGEAGEAFAQYLQKLGKDGVLDSAIDGEIAKQAFIDGKSPFIVTGPWNIADFEAAGIDLAVTEIPSAGGEPAQPFVGVQGAYISAKSENPLLANDFVVNYLSTEEAADTIYASGNRIPALTASADKIDNAITKSFAEVAAQGAPMPSIPEMGSVWAFWGSTEVAIISGSASDAAGAWNTMNENIEGAIAGN